MNRYGGMFSGPAVREADKLINGNIQRRVLRMQITIKDVLQEKGSTVWSVKSSDMVYEALKIFADKDIGALLVIDDGKLPGIFTERDYARKVFSKQNHHWTQKSVN